MEIRYIVIVALLSSSSAFRDVTTNFKCLSHVLIVLLEPKDEKEKSLQYAVGTKRR